MATRTPGGQWMVECFWPGVSQEVVDQATARIDAACADLPVGPASAHRVATTYVPAEETVFWLFEAAEEATVLALARAADVRVDRIQPVVATTASGT
jgi:hypothetical protein